MDDQDLRRAAVRAAIAPTSDVAYEYAARVLCMQYAMCSVLCAACWCMGDASAPCMQRVLN